MESGSGPVLVPPAGTHPSGWGKMLQIAALVFAVPAVAWGVFVLYTTVFPSPCGDFSGVADLGVAECWVVDLPVGFLALGAGLLVKRGSPRLRKVCITTSLVTLSLPIVATVALQHFHCR
jgi:hypothetical protein